MLTLLRKRWVYHTLAWMLAFGTFVFLEWDDGMADSFWSLMEDSLRTFSIPLVLIYAHLWGKNRFLPARAYRAYVAWLAGVVLLGLLIYWLDVSDGNSFWQDLVNVVFFLVASTGIQDFKRGLVEQQQQQEARARLVETELRALRAQLNPHFLFNTLNNIHGVNLHDSERGSEMIVELSAVMRYHLEYSQRNEISLEDEVELLEGYIKLEQLRLGENCELRVRLPENPPAVTISPLLLLPFIENAFKHGTHPTRPCHVHISLETGGASILLEVKNSRIEPSGATNTGVGLANVRRRLELSYPNRHKLDLKPGPSEFHARLTLQL